MAQIIRHPRQHKPKGTHPMPDHFDAHDLRRLLRLCARRGFCYEEVQYGVSRTREWASQGKLRKDWVLCVTGYMRSGWAVQGYRKEALRLGRTSTTKLTDEVIEAVVARQAERLGKEKTG